MKTATERLIDLAERLNPTGLIGDGMVAEFHDLARKARAELDAYVTDAENLACSEGAFIAARPYTPRPRCYRSDHSEQDTAENDCDSCRFAHACLDI